MAPKPRSQERDPQAVKQQHPHHILPQSVRCTNDISVLRDEFRSCLVDIKSLKQHLHEKQVLIDRNSEKLLHLQDADPEARNAALRTEILRLAKQIEASKANINRLLAELEWRNKETETGGDGAAANGGENSNLNGRSADTGSLRNIAMLCAVRDLLAAQKEKDYYMKKKSIVEDSLTKGAEVQHQDVQKKTRDLHTAQKNIESLRKQRDENIEIIARLQEELIQAGVSPLELQKMYKEIGMPTLGTQEQEQNTAEEQGQAPSSGKDRAMNPKQNMEEKIRKAAQQYEAEILSVSAINVQSAALKEASLSRPPQQVSPYKVGGQATDAGQVAAPRNASKVLSNNVSPMTEKKNNKQSKQHTADEYLERLPDSTMSIPSSRERNYQMDEDAGAKYSPDRRLKAVMFDPPLPLDMPERSPKQTALPPSRGGAGGIDVVDTPSSIDKADPVENYQVYASQFSPVRATDYNAGNIRIENKDVEKAAIEDEINEEVSKRINTAKSKRLNAKQQAANDDDNLYQDDFDAFSDDIDEKILDKLNSTANLHQGAAPDPVERDPDDFDFFA